MKNILILSFLLLASYVSAQKTIKPPDNFVIIPMGQAKVDSQLVAVDALFMQDHEVTVGEYSKFLNYIRQHDNEMYRACFPDTSLWISLFTYSYNEPFTAHYHKHPSFYNYPINNITRKAANEYCKWYTQQYNSSKEAKKKGKGIFRLPTQAEWVRAARGDNHDWHFAWAGPYLKDTDCVKLANFFVVNDANISRNADGEIVVIMPIQTNNQGHYITSPVKQYKPNQFKLFDMCGNIAEMVSDTKRLKGGSWYDTGYDLRIDAPGDHLSVPSPMVGFRMVFVPLVEE